MKIKSLIIDYIQGIKHLEISDFSDNVTLIFGSVGLGKTTILESIYSFFCDAEIIRWYNGGGNASGKLSIVISNNDHIIKIDNNVLQEGNRYEICCEYNHDYISGNLANKVFYYKASHNEYDLTVNQLNEVIAFLDKYDIDIPHLSNISITNRHISIGQLMILKTVFFISKIPPGSIVLLDSLHCLDKPTIELLIELFNRINNIQFICEVNSCNGMNCHAKNIYLTDDICSKEISNNEILHKYIYQNSRKVECDDSEKLAVIKYKLNEVLQEEENTEVEYKSIKGNDPSRSIKDTAAQYAVAFLNSSKIKRGIIKWGISDDGVVEGVILNRKLRDQIRRDVQSCINNISPSIDSSCYEINFEKVLDENDEIIADLYVVELMVNISYSQVLYATGNGEVYIKLNGVKQKLTTYQIQLETLKRHGL